MNYYDAPQDPPQTSPIEPHSIISGTLPGATEIRLGNNIKISGKNEQVLITTTGGTVVVGATDDGRLALEATNSDGSKVGIGDIPGTTNLGLYSVDTTSHTTMTLGKQADGSNSLKFFDASNVGLAQFGKFSNGATALKVAKSNVEVGTATDDQLIFNSSQNIFKIALKSTTTIPSFTTGSGGTNYSIRTIAHGLSFTPIICAYASGAWVNGSSGVNTSTYIPLPVFTPRIGFGYFFSVGGGAYQPANIIYATDATNVYFQAETSSVPALATMDAIAITYYILQETVT